MGETETDSREEIERPDRGDDDGAVVEQAECPAPGIKHEREPDAENIMPAENRPGTF